MRVLIFGGTTEGRELALQCQMRNISVTVSVATTVGAEQLSLSPDIEVIVGRKCVSQMKCMMAGYDVCIDATHPYAIEVSENICTACQQMNMPYQRLLRDESITQGVKIVASCQAAATELIHTRGNIMLTTGSKELSSFSVLDMKRLYVRVLPTVEGITACEQIGLPHRNILALQGPFSVALNKALFEQYKIAWLVTKDGGSAGGFREKQMAAEALNIPVILIKRPQENGNTMQDILVKLERDR